MHFSTKLLFAVLAALALGATGWYVFDHRRAKRHRARRLAREAVEREEWEEQAEGFEEQATGTEGEGVGNEGTVIDAEAVEEVRDGTE